MFKAKECYSRGEGMCGQEFPVGILRAEEVLAVLEQASVAGRSLEVESKLASSFEGGRKSYFAKWRVFRRYDLNTVGSDIRTANQE